MTDYLHFNSRDEFHRIDISKIVYFQSNGNYTDIILTNKVRVVIGISLVKLETYLSETLKEKARCFIRVGKCCIINTDYILSINTIGQSLTLTDYNQSSIKISISKEALKKLKNIMVTSVLKTNPK